jgi:molecular chaperone DnaJ
MLKVPAGTQPETTFRIRGEGIPVAGGRGRGDLYVQVSLTVPTRLGREQKELIGKLAETEEAQNQPIQKKILDRVKEIFG